MLHLANHPPRGIPEDKVVALGNAATEVMEVRGITFADRKLCYDYGYPVLLALQDVRR